MQPDPAHPSQPNLPTHSVNTSGARRRLQRRWPDAPDALQLPHRHASSAASGAKSALHSSADVLPLLLPMLLLLLLLLLREIVKEENGSCGATDSRPHDVHSTDLLSCPCNTAPAAVPASSIAEASAVKAS
jgi:hypothetical protein